MTDASPTSTLRVPSSAATWLVVLTLTAAALAGCTIGDRPPSTPTASTNSPEAPVTDPDQVLQKQAEQTRTTVDGLTGLAPGADWIVNLDLRSVCGTPTAEDWPAQWGYSKTTLVPDGTSPSTLVDRLTKDGWRVTHQDNGSTAAAARTTAQRNGAVLTIRSTTKGVVAIAGTSACVDADGTIDARPVS